MFYKISIKTSSHTDFIDITPKVREVVKQSKVEEGICVIYVPHTTAGVFINENADPDVVYDVKNHLEKLVPWINNYKHLEGNAAAHIKSILTGNSISVIIDKGDLVLGTWQGIFFAEFDGPRSRNIFVKIIK
ncbi:secondary thiamine-phosphate synthase enzyme YjbQ [Sulfurihydrogenibium azorense]|uniref:secondary thiamine-phosphate synthase enzyme YjbQ n=1 Tax=Sulfurihydrogenibium azorense TaxID=309806 RepID=UPI00240916C8|nr:secondary thiamine-phosphate synthase enzyme YjbQ [Sulfurihydrogenibium azorense]MDM7273621.1 secondary thiamine-phosphate synthase enzyme YjbQ [Sulfurihydrogenibium azorense]